MKIIKNLSKKNIHFAKIFRILFFSLKGCILYFRNFKRMAFNIKIVWTFILFFRKKNLLDKDFNPKFQATKNE